MLERYLEDFSVGQVFHSGPVAVDTQAIKQFAGEFDPQYFHLDEEQAEQSLFQGLAASGWHTAAMTMKLLVASDMNPVGGLVGAGVEKLQWMQPVRAGDKLSIKIEILEARALKSRPDRGMLKAHILTVQQDGQPVQSLECNIVVQTAPMAESA